MAEEKVLKSVQAFHFADEMSNIAQNTLSSKAWKKERKNKTQLKGISSKLLALNPFLDNDGYLRVGSRLMRSSLEEESRTPIILPRTDQVVRCVVRYMHQKELHAGPKHVLNELRKSVWIIQGGQEGRADVTP